MSWTAPRTFSAGEVATASMFNVHLRDNLSALRDYMIGAQDLGADWAVSGGRSTTWTDTDVAHGMTTLTGTSVWARIAENSGTAGGAEFGGFSDTDSVAVRLLGVIGTTTPTVAPINIYGGKKSGTTLQAIASSELMVQFLNAGTAKFSMYGDGSLAWGSGATPQIYFDRSTGSYISFEGTNDIITLSPNNSGAEVTYITPTGPSTHSIGLGYITPHTVEGCIDFPEGADTTSPGADKARLFCKDNGFGKTQLCVRFNTGVSQVVATEP